MQTTTKYYPLGGGLDVVTPSLTVPPGRLLSCLNFEPHFNDGYSRIKGFERFDGRPRPHLQVFIGFDLVDATGLSLGDTLTGDTSGASGIVIGISGNSIGVTKVTSGPFQVGEDLNTAAYTISADTIPTEAGAPDIATEVAFIEATQTEYRDDILVVPGAGEVNGIWRLEDKTYAWRNNVGNTAGVMHNSSAAGWVTTGPILAHYLKFDGGGGGAAAELPLVGETVTGGTSGATGEVHKIINWAGGTATNDATGYLVLINTTGTPFSDNEALNVSATKRADSNGASAQVSFSTDGEYRFKNHNFFATSGSFSAYGVNSVDDAFEIDQAGIVSPIIIPTIDDLTGVTENNDPPAGKPFLVEIHKNHLFLAYPGGRVVSSVVGDPMNFSGFLNAAEFGLGDEVTGLNSVVGNVLVMTTEQTSQGLYGNDITDWEKKLIGERTGGKLYSTEKLDTVYALDDLGITSVERTDKFGDFNGSTVSQLIQPLINFLRSQVTDATVVRASNQVRWFFSDNSILVMYVPAPGSITEQRDTKTSTKVQFGTLAYPFPVNRIYNVDDEEETERSFFASTDGYVYEDQVGTNFDGVEIESYIRTVFAHLDSPGYRKKFRRLDLELQAGASREFSLRMAFDLTYGTPDIPAGAFDQSVLSAGSFWDTGAWDEFYWDGAFVSTARLQLGGTGENASFLFYNKSATTEPFILQGMTIHYDRRRLQR